MIIIFQIKVTANTDEVAELAAQELWPPDREEMDYYETLLEELYTSGKAIKPETP